MQTWIFQGNPDAYDIDGYLASRPSQVVWLVTRYADEIASGDRVYLWRNQGQSKAVAGIIAEAIVTEPPKLRSEDTEGVQFWREISDRGSAPQVRSALRLVRVASTREMLRRDWMLDDPILKDLPNLKMQAGTNYKISSAQAERLDALWNRTGRDWSRDEVIAGLWAYSQTYSGAVSKLPNSPVANVALQIGRAVSGVYAKVMNFRSLDPRVPGRGMTGGGEADRLVWAEYFDAQNSTLRVDDLKNEFSRIWAAEQSSVDAKTAAEAAQIEAHRLEAQGLSQLMAKYSARSRPVGRPAARPLSTRAYDRDPLVMAIGRKRADHRCEVRGCEHPMFETVDGDRYVEIHHIVPLADGGEDTIDNVACLCPAHHREVHLGVNAQELTAQLRSLRSTSVPPPHYSLARRSPV
jgi:hypothetical protein